MNIYGEVRMSVGAWDYFCSDWESIYPWKRNCSVLSKNYDSSHRTKWMWQSHTFEQSRTVTTSRSWEECYKLQCYKATSSLRWSHCFYASRLRDHGWGISCFQCRSRSIFWTQISLFSIPMFYPIYIWEGLTWSLCGHDFRVRSFPIEIAPGRLSCQSLHVKSYINEYKCYYDKSSIYCEIL